MESESWREERGRGELVRYLACEWRAEIRRGAHGHMIDNILILPPIIIFQELAHDESSCAVYQDIYLEEFPPFLFGGFVVVVVSGCLCVLAGHFVGCPMELE